MDLLKMKYLFIFVSLVALTQLIFSQSNTLVLKIRFQLIMKYLFQGYMMKNFLNKSNYNIVIISSFFVSLILVHIFYLAFINPLSFEYMSYAKLNNIAPERHFSVILKDPEQKYV